MRNTALKKKQILKLLLIDGIARQCAGQFFLLRSNGLRSARARGGAGFFFELVLALVARDWFFLLVKWLALRAGQR